MLHHGRRYVGRKVELQDNTHPQSQTTKTSSTSQGPPHPERYSTQENTHPQYQKTERSSTLKTKIARTKLAVNAMGAPARLQTKKKAPTGVGGQPAPTGARWMD